MGKQRKCECVHCILQAVCMWCIMYSFAGHCTLIKNEIQRGHVHKKNTSDLPVPENSIFEINDSCKELPTIQPAGSFFLDKDIQMGSSPDEVDPSFHVGTVFKDKSKVSWHMMADIANFYLIKKLLREHGPGVAF